MNLKLSVFPILLGLSSFCFGQTYPGTGGIINDDNTLNDYIIHVHDLAPEILNQEHGLTRVCINLTHTWVSDLDIRLISPDGTNLMLTATKGDDLDNYENTCFDMQATEHIINALAPFTGDFRPFTTLGNVNNGSSGIGQWTLRIFDQFAFADGGEVLSWSLTFGEGAALPFVLDSTSFPIILLTTDNITIPNEPKIPGYIKVINNGVGITNHISDTPVFESNMAIEVRGASSQAFPKKSFGFETQDEFGDDLEIQLLGLPKEEDWILYAPYTDKSFIRDALTYKLGNDLGRYTPRTVFVELFLNGDYHGVYCLEEKIKRDKNRVDITKLNAADTIGDALTGGYILKVDRDDGPETYFVSNYEGTDTTGEVRIVYEDPEGPDLHPLQQSYIQNFFHSFEAALYSDNFMDEALGYRRYADVSSFVDFFIISELGHNVDAYRLSTFMYKNRDSKDSLLHLGPLWDFNLAYGNVNYCESQLHEGWAYEHSGACGNTPLWWPRLLEDPLFIEEVNCRYTILREGPLSTENLIHYVDSMATVFASVESRNYERWPILGIYVWPNHFIGQTYEEEISYMKDWIIGRLNWLDENMPGECLIISTDEGTTSEFIVSPNPANESIRINSSTSEKIVGNIVIADARGSILISQRISDNQEEIDVTALPAGIYFLTLVSNQGKAFREKFIVIH